MRRAEHRRGACQPWHAPLLRGHPQQRRLCPATRTQTFPFSFPHTARSRGNRRKNSRLTSSAEVAELLLRCHADAKGSPLPRRGTARELRPRCAAGQPPRPAPHARGGCRCRRGRFDGLRRAVVGRAPRTHRVRPLSRAAQRGRAHQDRHGGPHRGCGPDDLRRHLPAAQSVLSVPDLGPDGRRPGSPLRSRRRRRLLRPSRRASRAGTRLPPGGDPAPVAPLPRRSLRGLPHRAPAGWRRGRLPCPGAPDRGRGHGLRRRHGRARSALHLPGCRRGGGTRLGEQCLRPRGAHAVRDPATHG